jgi:hypothetical protein
VGKNVGVAPEADLYFIGTSFKGRDYVVPDSYGFKGRDFKWAAQAVDKIIEINKNLPENRKIRVLSMSVGWDKREDGY